MRRTRVVSAFLKYQGNPQRKLKEGELIKRLKQDDLYRVEMGNPVWMDITKSAVERMAEEDGVSVVVRPDKAVARQMMMNRGAPVDYGEIGGYGVNESVLRKLVDQGVSEFTEVQKQLFEGLNEENDIFASAYTGSGKSFGLAMAVADRMLSQPPTLPYSYVVVAPSVQLVNQLRKWIVLFVGGNIVGTLTEEDLNPVDKFEISQKKPYVLIATHTILKKIFQPGAGDSSPYHEGRPGRRSKLSMDIKSYSQMLVFDEADIYNNAEGMKFLRKIIRIQGGVRTHAHAVPQQQCIFTSATMGQNDMSEFRKVVRTSYVQLEAGAFVGAAGVHINRGKRYEAHKIITYDEKSFTFPPKLHHGFVVTSGWGDVTRTIGKLVGGYGQHGYAVPGMSWEPPAKQLNITFKNPKVLLFTAEHLVDQITTALNTTTPYPTTGFTGSATDLETTLETFTSTPTPAILVLPHGTVRGLDFINVTHVLILGKAPNPQVYAHLAGRAARNGSIGCAVTMLKREEVAGVRRDLRNKVNVVATEAGGL